MPIFATVIVSKFILNVTLSLGCRAARIILRFYEPVFVILHSNCKNSACLITLEYVRKLKKPLKAAT